ncbi:hypothetical protein EXIGLDRAFT_767628 [Exidia glandulosa HHB12029]|uniref:DUF6533 domain-containing protein n=1 Tax=Exidia glandulosa HHB12029 TaxID=1314781 RepID=A0A166AP60_EXIGL|nr:hypothetical protein EXIGLDRAFT_767628 [Exidia glandulosa HHB12029]
MSDLVDEATSQTRLHPQVVSARLILGFLAVAAEIACIALFFWDWVITLDDEVELIWRQQSWRAGAFFLPLLRADVFRNVHLYPEGRVPIAQMSNVEVWIRVISMILIIILVQIILQLRVYIMYNRSRTLLRLNGAFFVFEIAVTVALLAVFSQRIQYLPLTSNCGECIIWPRELGYCYVVPLIFEAYLATLMVKRSWENRRLFDELEGQSLFYILVRDSVVYFFLVSSALAASMLAFFIAPNSMDRHTCGLGGSGWRSASHLIHATGCNAPDEVDNSSDD